jgi:hypothetical protein
MAKNHSVKHTKSTLIFFEKTFEERFNGKILREIYKVVNIQAQGQQGRGTWCQRVPRFKNKSSVEGRGVWTGYKTNGTEDSINLLIPVPRTLAYP